MTRTMPGPPEHCYCRDGDQPCRSCLDDGGFYPGGVCPGCDLHNGRSESHHKHLSDAECDAEDWRAMNNVLRYEDGDPGQAKAIRHADTCNRFTIHPHAFEETPDD